MTYEELKRRPELLLLDCISGSTAYNLSIKGSDLDKKGIYAMPKQQFYGFFRQQQISNDSHDELYFEIERFLELLNKNNPNILELLFTPKEFVLYRHPLLDCIRPEDFLSKLCLDTFAGYAFTQVKKARGLNKKINKPIDEERKRVTDFCYVIHESGTLKLKDWLELNAFAEEDCGLIKLPHFRDVYQLYHQQDGALRGIVSGPAADDIQLSSIPKGLLPVGVLNFNKDSYSMHCREYREYRDWEEKRNQLRYQGNVAHGKNYDAKNMMHTFRLLHMAEEIALMGQLQVHRQDRDFLLKVRSGAFQFDELMFMIEEKMEKTKALYARSALPDEPAAGLAEELLLQIRAELYH